MPAVQPSKGHVVRVAVIGGGAQGVLAALELASAGVAVHLYEAESTCLTQASLNNEGKVHLGYVYANDPTLATARLMIDGALSFEPLLRRLDVAVDEIAVSAPFQYVVARGSLVDAGALEAHVQACHRVVQLAGQGAYFGSDLRAAPHRIALDGYDDRAVTAAFRTPEIAVDPRSLAPCSVVASWRIHGSRSASPRRWRASGGGDGACWSNPPSAPRSTTMW